MTVQQRVDLTVHGHHVGFFVFGKHKQIAHISRYKDARTDKGRLLLLLILLRMHLDLAKDKEVAIAAFAKVHPEHINEGIILL